MRTKGKTNFTYDGEDVLLDDIDGTQTKYLNGPGIDNKLRSKTGTSASYFLSDHLGSTDGLTDTSGALTSSTGYDAFGNQTANLSTRYGFTGRERDDVTGLMYYRARWYDPSIGRFISEDPIGLAGGLNNYLYVGNNSINHTDSYGLFPSIWPWDYHRRISQRALAGLASPSQIESISRANADFDSRTQDPIYAPYHAMRRPGQTVDEARSEANEFVRNKICSARAYAEQGLNDEAMAELAKAMHTLQDSASPSHFGFQEAWPDIWFWTMAKWEHYTKENFDPGAGSVADFQTARAWGYFTGNVPMPSNFFNDNVVDWRDDWSHVIAPRRVR